MAKKGTGPKEAQLRKMREDGHNGAIVQLDRTAVADARKAARELAEQLFEKEMSKHLKPIDARIEEIEARRVELDNEVAELERELNGLRKTRADILGVEDKPVKAKGSKGPTGARFPKEQLPDVAETIAKFISAAGDKGTTRKEILEHIAVHHKSASGKPYQLLPSVKVPDFVKENGGKLNIVTVGERAGQRIYDHDFSPKK